MHVGDFFFVEASDEFWEDGEEIGDFTDDRGLDSDDVWPKDEEEKCFDTVHDVGSLGSDDFRSIELIGFESDDEVTGETECSSWDFSDEDISVF